MFNGGFSLPLIGRLETKSFVTGVVVGAVGAAAIPKLAELATTAASYLPAPIRGFLAGIGGSPTAAEQHADAYAGNGDEA